MFEPAVKEKLPARIALFGPSGSGKTYTALALASGLGKKIAVIDTENRSASLYSDAFQFDTAALTVFSPANYIAAIKAAEADGYDVVVIDSLSHAWNGSGGVLDIKDAAAKRSQGNDYAGWRTATPAHNSLVDALLQTKCHVIVTMRSKTEYVVEQKSNGKSAPRKIGMAPVQRDGMEYEFTVIGEMDYSHTMVVTKSRYAPWQDKEFERPTAETVKPFAEWLDSGSTPKRAEPPKKEDVPAHDKATADDTKLLHAKRKAFTDVLTAKAGKDAKALLKALTGKESTDGMTLAALDEWIITAQQLTDEDVARKLQDTGK